MKMKSSNYDVVIFSKNSLYPEYYKDHIKIKDKNKTLCGIKVDVLHRPVDERIAEILTNSMSVLKKEIISRRANEGRVCLKCLRKYICSPV